MELEKWCAVERTCTDTDSKLEFPGSNPQYELLIKMIFFQIVNFWATRDRDNPPGRDG